MQRCRCQLRLLTSDCPSRYAYNLANNRWISLGLQSKKKRAGGGAKAKRRAAEQRQQQERAGNDEDVDMDVDLPGPVRVNNGDDDDDDDEDEGEDAGRPQTHPAAGDMEIDDGNAAAPSPAAPVNEDRPVAPLERYNAMITILKNTLYVYGGIYETERREYTLDDFYTLNLEKRSGWVTLRASGIEEETWAGSDDDEDGDDDDEGMDDGDASSDDDDDDGEDEEIEQQMDAAEDEADDGDAEHARMSQAEKVSQGSQFTRGSEAASPRN